MSERGQFMGGALVTALNKALEFDDESRKRLRRMQGLQLGVEITGPDLKFIIRVDDQKLVLADEDDAETTTWLKASPGAFMAVAASGGKLNTGRMQISGDAETGRQFQQLFQSMNPDFEEAMSRLFGDVVGVQLARASRGLKDWITSAGYRMSETASDYFRVEGRLLVNREEMDEFLDAVDDLRDDVEHIERRVAAVMSKHGQDTAS